jgi:AAA+ superfamily predicted ATPase
MPLPDAAGREQLLDLYAEGLDLDVRDRTGFVSATEGTTPAFIRELLRRAALFAAERGMASRVDDELLTLALTELRESSDQLGATLLGAPALGSTP